jgi:hypothetical protein
MEERNPARYAASIVLKELTQYPEEDCHLSDVTSYIFFNEEDEFFTTNEEIIEEVKKLISDEYELQVVAGSRTFEGENPGENFTYEDTILKLIKKDD